MALQPNHPLYGWYKDNSRYTRIVWHDITTQEQENLCERYRDCLVKCQLCEEYLADPGASAFRDHYEDTLIGNLTEMFELRKKLGSLIRPR